MVVKGSGALSFDTDIVGEFKGSRPHSLSEYYSGGANVPAGTKNAAGGTIPAGGAIKFSDFYGAAAQIILQPGSLVIPAGAGNISAKLNISATQTGGTNSPQGSVCPAPNGARAGDGAPGMEITIPAGTTLTLYLPHDVIGGGGQGGTAGGCAYQPGGRGGNGGPGILVHGAPGSLIIDPSSPGHAIGGGGGASGGTYLGGNAGVWNHGGGGGAPFGKGGLDKTNSHYDATATTGGQPPTGWGGSAGAKGGNVGDAANGWNGYNGDASQGGAPHGSFPGGSGGLSIQYV